MINGNKAWALLALLVGAGSFQNARAEETPAPSTVQATSRSLIDRARDRFSVTYFGQLYGPSLDAPDPGGTPVSNVPHTLSDSGQQGASAYLHNDLRLNIKSSLPVTFRAQVRFTMRPWVDPNTDGSLVHPFDFLNPRVGAYNFRQVNSQFSLLTWIWGDIPTNMGAIKRSLITDPALLVVPEYRLGSSAVYSGAYLMARGWIYANGDAAHANNGLMFDGYVAPYVKWNFKGRVSAVGTFEWYPQYALDTSPSGGDWATPPVDIQLALNWEVNDSFWVQPYVQIFPSQLSLRTSMVGAYVGATLF